MEKRSTNSFTELDTEAYALVKEARHYDLPTLTVESNTAKLRTEISRLFIEGQATDQNIATLTAEFRQNLIDSKCPVGLHSLMGAIVGFAARAKENPDTALLDQFEPILKNALTTMSNHDGFSMAFMEIDPSETLEKRVDSLLHATRAVCNFDQAQTTYASQDEVDWYFYHSYYHGIKCRFGKFWCEVRRYERHVKLDEKIPRNQRHRTNALHYQEMGELAFDFTNGFFNLLHQVSDHPCCSRMLRTLIRTHLIDFTDKKSTELYGWETPYDITQHDLRVSKDDIKHTNKSEMFNIKRKNLKDYCYDA